MKIAVIAHDGKKANMVQFLFGYKDLLQGVELVATGTTGTHVEQAGLTVHKMLSGPLGGDAQIATMVVEKEIDLVIFFRDPLSAHPHWCHGRKPRLRGGGRSGSGSGCQVQGVRESGEYASAQRREKGGRAGRRP